MSEDFWDGCMVGSSVVMAGVQGYAEHWGWVMFNVVMAVWIFFSSLGRRHARALTKDSSNEVGS